MLCPTSKVGNYTHQFTASIALHGLSLAVASKVVGAATLVAGRSSRVSPKASTTSTTTERSAKVSTVSIATAASTSTRAGARSRAGSSALGVRGWAVALSSVLANVALQRVRSAKAWNLRPSGQAVHSYSIGRWQSRRSDAGLGSPPEHGPIPGSGSTAWLGECQKYFLEIITRVDSLSVVRGRGQALDSCPVQTAISQKTLPYKQAIIWDVYIYQVLCLEKQH